MRKLLTSILLLLLLAEAAPAQVIRWFGFDRADSTRWGWNLPFGLEDGFCLPGDSLCLHPMKFAYVATDTASLTHNGCYLIFDGYWMSLTEVTQAQWICLMGEPLKEWMQRGDDLPAVVSQEQAQAFCHRLDSTRLQGARLPCQEELDFAYHGGHFSEGYRYSGSNTLTFVAWTDGRLHPVAQKVPNELGLYDMDSRFGGFRVVYSRQMSYYDALPDNNNE